MQLSPGARLGSYEIISAIGAGGMGEVYRARDTRLNRDVAIKVLPDVFAADPDRLARFEREAQTLAALNHPHIAHIHGIEESGSLHALVMEFVDGEDLAQRLQRGAVPLEEAIEIATQIADALEAAHERGVIHRDLKPANVKLTADGTAKVLDFGLAKALDPSSPGLSGSAANSPTFTSPAVTHMGVILGTAAYMSPEQAKGKPVDRRADIWALGVVLFEMLTGRLLYQGETVTETIAHVITQPANLDALPPGTPATVRRILRRCLEKDPRKRFHSAGDVRVELEEALAPALPPEGGSHTVASHKVVLPWAGWAVAAAIAIVSIVAVLKPFRRAAVPAAPALEVDIRLPAEAPLVVDENVDGALATLSPDGQTLVYLGSGQASRRLYVRRLDSPQATPLSGTEEAGSPFFSPDGKWIAFFSRGELKRIPINGGTAMTVAPAQDGRGGTWGHDDVIVFTPHTNEGLFRVAAAGGTPERVTTRNPNERTHRWPAFIPGTDVVLFITQEQDGAYDDGVIEALRLSTKERKVVMRGGTFPRYLTSGHLTYVREQTLFAVPFDERKLEVRGAAEAILSPVLSSRGVGAGVGNGAAQIAFSETGSAVLIAGGAFSARSKLVVADRDGKVIFASPEARDYRSPRFSPDGTRIAVQVDEGPQSHVFVLDLKRATFTKVTFAGLLNGAPTWSRDGTTLAFFSDRAPGGLNIFTVRSDGAGEPKAVTPSTGDLKVPVSFSPDGSTIVGILQRVTGTTGFDIVTYAVADGTATPFVASPGNDVLPVFSPDGKWIAYQSDEVGRPEVHVRPYPPRGGRWVIPANAAAGPVWTKKGRELIFLGGQNVGSVMAVDIEVVNDAIQVGRPSVLFEVPVSHPANAWWMDASADGSRIVFLRAEDAQRSAGQAHVTLITNFFDRVRKAVGR